MEPHFWDERRSVCVETFVFVGFFIHNSQFVQQMTLNAI